jgi:hypothetical protein
VNPRPFLRLITAKTQDIGDASRQVRSLADHIGLEPRCAERKFISLTSGASSDSVDLVETYSALICAVDRGRVQSPRNSCAQLGAAETHRNSNLLSRVGAFERCVTRDYCSVCRSRDRREAPYGQKASNPGSYREDHRGWVRTPVVCCDSALRVARIVTARGTKFDRSVERRI